QKKILLALDGSDNAFETVKYVSRITPFKKMRIVLFNVFNKIPDSYWDMERQPNVGRRVREVQIWEMQNEKIMKEYMEKARQKLLASGFPHNNVQVKIHKRKSGIARDIIMEAKRDYSAVAVSRKGISKLRGLVLGSVTNKLLVNLDFVPLFVVGKTTRPERFLLCIDGSGGAKRAVDYVGSILNGSDYEVNLTHVIREEEKQYIGEAEINIGAVFDYAKTRLIDSGINPNQINTQIITEVKSRAGAIVKEAKQGGYGTIVVGRRGISNVPDFFMGRVSNKVVHLSSGNTVWVVH
ncbi:MAG: universal stress protein, partial [Deltaproteobacteria bacterium]|nr:universal stress protein [Deltaproteobacteria bacterium]